jgi:hypothetical protein
MYVGIILEVCRVVGGGSPEKIISEKSNYIENFSPMIQIKV